MPSWNFHGMAVIVKSNMADIRKKKFGNLKKLIYQKILHNLLIKLVSWVEEPGPFQMPEKNQFLIYYLY